MQIKNTNEKHYVWKIVRINASILTVKFDELIIIIALRGNGGVNRIK